MEEEGGGDWAQVWRENGSGRWNREMFFVMMVIYCVCVSSSYDMQVAMVNK